MSSRDFFGVQEEQSRIKTELVEKYLKAWSKVVLPWASGPIAYVDLFSGPGRYADGSPSTPLQVISIAIDDDILRDRLEITFNDKESNYTQMLQEEISGFAGIEKLARSPRVSNEVIGRNVVEVLRTTELVPTLFFIDPWGYKGLSLDLVGNAIRSWGCDCIFFFNYNRVNLGINNPAVAERMGELFGVGRANKLRQVVEGKSSDERHAMIINELAKALKEVGGKYVLPFEFRSRHGERPSHHIFFVSKHFRGYHIMKEVMFSLSTDDGDVKSFEFMPVKSPQLPLLFDLAKPYSITSLKSELLHSFAGRSLKVWDIYEAHSVDTPYTLRNVKDALCSLESDGKITVDVPANKRQKRKGKITLADHRIVTFPP